MTSRGKDDLDDEFEAFLAGRGELARPLSALPQPESPALLNDAIIASIKAEMAQEQATRQRPAANDAGNQAGDAAAMPPAFRPSWMMRWRVPLAMAASVAGAVLLMLEWQREENAPPPVQAEIREQDRTAAASGSASAPQSEAPMLAKPIVPAIPKAAHKALKTDQLKQRRSHPATPSKPRPRISANDGPSTVVTQNFRPCSSRQPFRWSHSDRAQSRGDMNALYPHYGQRCVRRQAW